MGIIHTGTDQLTASSDAGVATLVLNRPGSKNALSDDMLDAIAQTLNVVERDDSVMCVLLTGAGDAFCAGGDVKAMAAVGDGRTQEDLDIRIRRQRTNQRAVCQRLWEFPKPSIAAVNGVAAGAGLSLALACDLRFGTEGTFFLTAFAGVGLAGDYGATWLLTRHVGSARAREMFLLNRRIGAEDAKSLGLLSDVIKTSSFGEDVLNVALELARGPGTAYRYMKENLNRAVGGSFGECLDMEATYHLLSAVTPYHRDAARAFVARRNAGAGS